MGGGGKIRLLILALTGLLAGCTSKSKPPEPEPVVYTLTLDANGGTLATGTNDTQQLTSGSRATRPADPTRTDYIFIGWATTQNGTDSFDFNSAISANLTLYAKWEALYTVILNVSGGTLPAGVNDTQQVRHGRQATRPADPTRTGFTFGGWVTAPSGSEAFDFSRPITEALTLYARWEIIYTTVTLEPNDSRPADPTRAREGRWDFEFAYWSADKRTRFDFTTPVTQTTTLYAMWSVDIPDAKFRTQLKGRTRDPYYGNGITGIVPSAFDGDRLVVNSSDVTDLTSMSVTSSDDLSGIEFFTALTKLNCSYGQLTSLDVSRNTALTWLDCYRNQLTSLNVSGATALTWLRCGSNLLTSLDVSRNIALTDLSCGSYSYVGYGNQLTALDVSRNTALTWLSCENNQLTALDVSRNTALTWLSCGENQFTALDVSRNTALTGLDCRSNQLTALDLSRNTALTYLVCIDNQLLTTLDITGMRSNSNSAVRWLSNPNLALLKVHTNLKDESAVFEVEGSSTLTVEVYDAPAGSTNYTKICSNYRSGRCLTP